MLFNRWGVLRRALPATIRLDKVTQLVCCLCKLHNFCVDERLERNGINTGSDTYTTDNSDGTPPPLESDHFNLLLNGAVPLERSRDGTNDHSPEQLLHGGEHFESLPLQVRRQLQREQRELYKEIVLPRTLLDNMVADMGLVRPTPKRWN